MPAPVPYARLATEQTNPRSRNLDERSIPQLLRLMNHEDASVPRAVARAIPQIASAVSLITRQLRAGGRLCFLGAGTSGRLGVLEGAECPPTFNTPPSLVHAIIAGGRSAVFRSREGAEDDRAAATRIITQRIRRGDAVVGIAASGATPFVLAGLQAARRRGAKTIFVTCSPRAALTTQVEPHGQAYSTRSDAPRGANIPPSDRMTHRQRGLRPRPGPDSGADVVIGISVGPEVLTGSTRLKAGTATKLILNMLTLGTMVQLGKVYGHLMVDVRPTSRKLRDRAIRIIQQIAEVSTAEAARALDASHGQTKLAIVIAARKVEARRARRLLARHRGRLRVILA